MAANLCLTLFAANCYCDCIACELVYLFTVMCSFVLGLFLVVYSGRKFSKYPVGYICVFG